MSAKTRVKDRSDYEYAETDAFNKGIDRYTRPDLLEPASLFDAENLVLANDIINVDTGVTLVNQDFMRPTVGRPQRIVRFKLNDGQHITILVTTKCVYRWSASTQTWEIVPTAVDTTVDGAVSGVDITVFDVVDATGFSVGDTIAVQWGVIEWHTVITGIASETITVSPSLSPDDEDIVNGAYVRQGFALNGDDEENVDYALWLVDDRVYFTNNTDPPFYYDATGDSCTTVENLPGSTFKAKCVANYAVHIHFFNCEVDGTRFPQRRYNCDTGDPTEWTTGNAGFTDYYDTPGGIEDTEPFGNDLIMYKSDAVIQLTFQGDSQQLFRDDTVIGNKGAMSIDCVLAIDNYHLIFDRYGIFYYEGGTYAREVSDKVNSLYTDLLGDMANLRIHECFAVYSENTDEALFFYPSIDSTVGCDKVLRLDLKSNAWLRRTLRHEVRGYGWDLLEDALTWDEGIMSWLASNFTWNSNLTQGNIQRLFLCSAEDNYIYQYNYQWPTDDEFGAEPISIPYTLETGDYESSYFYIRTDAVNMLVRGTDVTLSISLDAGDTWEALRTFSTGDNYVFTVVGHQRTSRTIRYRLTGAGGNFSLKWFTAKLRQESEY